MPRLVPHDIAVRGGKIIAAQKRAIPNVAAEGLAIHQDGSTYYVSFDLSGGIEVPAPCAVRIEARDMDVVDAEVEKLTEQSLSGDVFLEVNRGNFIPAAR